MIGELDDIKIEVVHAIHGYQPLLKGAKEVHENIGYIIDDESNRLYTTSDTICFKNDSIDDRQELPVFLREEFPADIREVRIYVSERQNHFWKD